MKLDFSYCKHDVNNYFYFPDDNVGKILAVLALTPLYVGAALSGLVLRCRDLHTVSYIYLRIKGQDLTFIVVDFLLSRYFVK